MAPVMFNHTHKATKIGRKKRKDSGKTGSRESNFHVHTVHGHSIQIQYNALTYILILLVQVERSFFFGKMMPTNAMNKKVRWEK